MANSKKKNTAKWVLTAIAILLVMVILAGVCVQVFAPDGKKVTDWFNTDWFSKTECEHIDEDSDGICDNCGEEMPDSGESETAAENTITATRAMSVSLYSLEGETSTDSGISAYAATVGVSKTLTATVLPSTASQVVDWSIYWADLNNTSSVTDYVTVTPESDGSTTATVTCYAPFSGTVIVRATTRDNGKFCTCAVTFEGVPSVLSIQDHNFQTYMGCYCVPISSSSCSNYSMTFSLSNVFNQVGSKYGNYTVTAERFGTCKYGSYSSVYGWSTLKTIDFADWNPTWYGALNEVNGELIDFTISGNTMNVKVLPIMSTFSDYDSSEYFEYGKMFNSFVTTSGYHVTVTETLSGLTRNFDIVYYPGLSDSVSVSCNSLVF